MGHAMGAVSALRWCGSCERLDRCRPTTVRLLPCGVVLRVDVGWKGGHYHRTGNSATRCCTTAPTTLSQAMYYHVTTNKPATPMPQRSALPHRLSTAWSVRRCAPFTCSAFATYAFLCRVNHPLLLSPLSLLYRTAVPPLASHHPRPVSHLQSLSTPPTARDAPHAVVFPRPRVLLPPPAPPPLPLPPSRFRPSPIKPMRPLRRRSPLRPTR